MTKLIRVKKDTYAALASASGKLQIRLKRFVSLDETVRWLLAKKDKNARKLWPILKQAKLRKNRKVHTSMNRKMPEKTPEKQPEHRREVG